MFNWKTMQMLRYMTRKSAAFKRTVCLIIIDSCAFAWISLMMLFSLKHTFTLQDNDLFLSCFLSVASVHLCWIISC